MRTIIAEWQAALKEIYTETEINKLVYLALEKIACFDRVQLLTKNDLTLNEMQRYTIDSYVNRLKNGEPIQYILGETEFFGLKIHVNQSALIPRPETEELVEWMIEVIGRPRTKILDIGTGSGCIPIALKKNLPDSDISAMDVSDAALGLALENATSHDVNITFYHDDILNPKNNYDGFDVIVSNPPYIPLAEKSEMDRNVVAFEPHLALFVEDHDPLLFYRAIALFAYAQLPTGGMLFFETHFELAQAVGELLLSMGFAETEVRKDISGNERMVKAVKV